MNKADLIEQIAQAAEISKSAAERSLDALVGAVKSSLRKDEMVTLVGFGTFYAAKRAARTGPPGGASHGARHGAGCPAPSQSRRWSVEFSLSLAARSTPA